MKKVLLSGAAGFLGSHLIEKLLINNYDIIGLKRSNSDISKIEKYLDKIKIYDVDMNPVENIFNDNNIDYIIHTATNYGRNNESVIDVAESNIIFPLKLLHYAQLKKVKVFINTDTFTKPDYGRLKNYSLTKKQFNEWLNCYENDMKIFNLKIHQMYGENDNKDKFIPFIINSMLDNKDNIDLTDGEQRRDFIYIEDVCDAYLGVLDSMDKFDFGHYSVEVGTGYSTSIKEVVLQIKNILNNNTTSLNFGALPYTLNEEMNICADIESNPKNILWKSKTSLKDGLLKTISWYKNNREIK